MNKQARHNAIRERARRAISDLYHNATPRYPSLEGREAQHFESWFPDTASFEIEYLQDGGAYGRDYRKTLAAECNAGKYKSERARAYYIDKGMRAMKLERTDCGAITGWQLFELTCAEQNHIARGYAPAARDISFARNDAMWERISDYGKLYQYGRGGRTLAPEDLVHTGGGSSFSMCEDYPEKLDLTQCVRLIRIVESFNRNVAQWCASVPELWAEYWKELQRDERRAKHYAKIARDVLRAFT